MPSEPLTPVVLVPYGDDPLAAAAQQIVEHCAGTLPRLDRVLVLLPDLQHGARLRRALIEAASRRGYDALLGPRIETIATYLATLPLPCPAVLPDDARELVLIESLREHAGLFGQADPWRLARSLLELFDELNLQQCALPRDLEDFRRILNRGYGVSGVSPAHLSREAEIVHTLWHAWQQQLQAEDTPDHNTWYVRALAESVQAIAPEMRLFLVGYSNMRPAEIAWVQRLQQRGQAQLLLHGDAAADGYHPDAPIRDLVERLGVDAISLSAAGPCSAGLNAVFDLRQGNLCERAAALRDARPQSPLAERLSVFAAADSEQEARAVELQVRRWLVEGKRSIGIVTEDRRLARRVRALLERAGITLADGAGWALSTTSSATVIERWLQAIEEDFAHQPLMDLLKSPFLLPGRDEEAADYRRAVYRLEQDIILHENIARGLDRFRKHLQYRQRRLGWSPEASAAVAQLLERLEHAAQPLLAMLRTSTQGLDRFTAALLESLTRLDVLPRLNADAAGTRILQQLDQLHEAARQRPLACDWLAFRTWLGAALERSHFRPPSSNAGVQLLSLEQTALARFDAVVLAAAEQEFLPGSPTVSPYLNDQVRRELGLPVWRQQTALRLHHFRRLLEAAPEVVITRRREQDGEELLPSPWLEALQTLHQQAYGDDLGNRQLAELLRDPRTQVQSPDAAALPAPSANPHAPLPAARLPRSVSAAAQQHLLDCPYQFFAADCLGLRPVEEIREALEKSDYGERVHRCLEAFHGGVSGLPGPFGMPLDGSSRARAVALLEEIAQAVFAQDLEDNFIHRGWLKRWLAMIPDYVDWQLERERTWHPDEVERSVERPLTEHWQLRGRLDRVDRGAHGSCAVIDYKTGAIPSAAEVQAGEAVQLVSYALLLDDVEQVEYLQLDKQIKSIARLEGEALAQLREDVGRRLLEMLEQISAGAALPAWGDQNICLRCPMAGLCRRQTWDGPVA